MRFHSININLSPEELKAVMDIRHKERTDYYMTIGDVRVFAFNEEILKSIDEKLNTLTTTCLLLGMEIGFDVEIKSQKRRVAAVFLHSNVRLDLYFDLDNEDRVRKITADFGYPKEELIIKKKKVNENDVTGFFNFIRETLEKRGV